MIAQPFDLSIYQTECLNVRLCECWAESSNSLAVFTLILVFGVEGPRKAKVGVDKNREFDETQLLLIPCKHCLGWFRPRRHHIDE